MLKLTNALSKTSSLEAVTCKMAIFKSIYLCLKWPKYFLYHRWSRNDPSTSTFFAWSKATHVSISDMYPAYVRGEMEVKFCCECRFAALWHTNGFLNFEYDSLTSFLVNSPAMAGLFWTYSWNSGKCLLISSFISQRGKVMVEY